VPTDRDAFLVIDPALSVQALSSRAEALLAISEEEAIDRLVFDLLVPADAEVSGPAGLAASIAQAARGTGEPIRTYVRPWNTFGVRLRARVTPCGPPRAALLVLQAPEDRPVRPVE
jgi:PAS domain-containing protein